MNLRLRVINDGLSSSKQDGEWLLRDRVAVVPRLEVQTDSYQIMD